MEFEPATTHEVTAQSAAHPTAVEVEEIMKLMHDPKWEDETIEYIIKVNKDI